MLGLLSSHLVASSALLYALPSARRTPLPMLSGGDEWSVEADWALLDGAKTFTIGCDGEQAATFWDALASSHMALRDRSASECAERMEFLSPGASYGRHRRM